MSLSASDGEVRILPDDLANQIAAGEVVERPSSVAKELVENAIDAGARRVRVDCEGGGIGLLRVADDGSGMRRKDAELAVLRHATSKLRALDDLRAIETFGFRGEALPSIASVSRFVLRTRVAEEAEGTEVRVEGGGPARVELCSSAVGTSIEVADLFYNVPVRRKFLKSNATESSHVTEVVEAAALSNPGVSFVLAREGRIVRELLRADSREERARSVFEGEVLTACRGARGPLRIEAFLSRPERARNGTGGLSLFVNGRAVKDRVLARAVAHAYGSVLEPGRYPLGVVHLDLPFELVDVNVHPQKAEVRFADGKAVADALYHVLRDALGLALGLPPSSPNRWGERKPKLIPEEQPSLPSWSWSGVGVSARGATIEAVKPEATQAAENAQPRSSAPEKEGKAVTAAPGKAAVEAKEPAPLTQSAPPLQASHGAPRRPLDLLSLAEERARVDASPSPAHPASAPAASSVPTEPLAPSTESVSEAVGPLFGSFRFLAQVRSTFLLCEGPDGLYVLDQHAAAERVTFDRLRRAYQARSVATQRLLFPALVELSTSEVELLAAAQAEVEAMGLDVRPAGPTTVALHAVPTLLKSAAPERLLRDLLGELGRTGPRAFSGAVDLVLATMACHGSLRAGDTVSPEEARALLKGLDGIAFAGHCPHGRPIVMRLGWGELETRVGRR